MVQGVDVWINTPRRPMEACGTSGMKVLVNGGLNLSTLDGWWAEAWSPDVGWALGDGDEGGDVDARDATELYGLLERSVAPEFYDRGSDGMPRRWIARMRASMTELAARFSCNRMARDYVAELYRPAIAASRARRANGAALARDLCRWERALTAHWPQLALGACELSAHDGGLRAQLQVRLGEVDPAAVRVELYAEPVEGEPNVFELARIESPDSDGWSRYVATIATRRPAGGFTARVSPRHRAACLPLELPLIRWQR